MRFLLEDLVRYAVLFGTDDGNSTIIATDDNPNDNRHLSAVGMSETLAMSFVGGFIIMVIFEKYRFYKQIYLKRLQNRFRVANRVPPYPSESVLGWFWEIQKVSEVEVLRMVGLDAYMCLRFIVVCYKLSLFLSFWGLIILLPLYSTVTPDSASTLTSWEKYSISNVVLGSSAEKQRLWFAAIFAYMFSAYFCQLLYAEYNHFSVKRLHYLVQKEADGLHVDPDTPPQKSFTVMIERIPSHLRSAQALFEYFTKLFPGDVYTVEIALDLQELNSKNAKRKRLRDKLEKAIAHYEAKNERLKVYARTGNKLSDDTKDGIFGEDGILEFLQKSFAPDKFGYERVDALDYYSKKLVKYNQDVKDLQDRYYKSMATIDKDLQRKLAQRYDTRFAAMFDSVTYAGARELLGSVSAKAPSQSNPDEHPSAQAPRKRGSKGNLPLPPRPSVKNTTSSSLNGEATSVGAVTTRPSFTSTPIPTTTTAGPTPRQSLASPQHPFIPSQHQANYTANSVTSPSSPTPKSGALSKLFSPLPPPGARATEILSNFHIEDLLFGPTGNDYRTAYEAEMIHLQSDEPITRRPSAPSASPNPRDIPEVIPNGPTTINPIHTQQPFAATSSTSSTTLLDSKQMSSEQRGGSIVSLQDKTASASLPTIREEGTSVLRGESTDTLNHIPITVDDDDARSGTSDVEQTEMHPTISSMLGDDVTIKEWMKKASLETDVHESLSTRKRGASTTNVHEAWKRDSQAEMKAYLDSATALGTPRASFLVGGGGSKRPSNVYGVSHHGSDSQPHSRENSSHGHYDPEVRRASELSSLAKSLLSSGIAVTNESKYADLSTHSYGAGGGGGSRNQSAHGYDASNGYGNNYDDATFAADVSAHRDQYRETASATPPLRDNYARTISGGLASILPTDLSSEQLDELTKLSIQRAQLLSEQTKVAGTGAWKALLEIERLVEMVTLGAYYKYSSTAFVTFNSRVTESIAQQMLLSPDAMEINHAPNPKDIIWDNVAIPKSQIVLRTYITNIGVVVGSIFWSSLVNSVNVFATFFPLPKSQQQTTSAIVLLFFLLLLPFVFDTLARYYEGYKLESEIQNAIMTRYFYYQLINVYVTVGFSGSNLWYQIYQILLKPATIIDVIGGRLPNVSLFFANLMVVKVFIALPLEMVRPYQLSTILLMSNCMDRRESTRRDLRSGTFYSWPMLYGWIYPQLMMVLMIMVTYCCITPLIMPFCVLFYAGAYVMYKYQLLYVYINEYQSGGYMWYAVFNRSLIALEFASLALIGYLARQLPDPSFSGPFFILLPLPVCLVYFGRYCDHKLKKASENLSYGFARQLDAVNEAEIKEGHKTPHDFFTKTCYRQPSLIEPEVYPEPYRNDGTYDLLTCKTTGETVVMADWQHHRQNRVGSISINVDELVDEGEENPLVLKEYWREIVLPLAVVPESSHGSDDGNDDERKPLRRRASRNEKEADVENPPEIATRERR